MWRPTPSPRVDEVTRRPRVYSIVIDHGGRSFSKGEGGGGGKYRKSSPLTRKKAPHLEKMTPMNPAPMDKYPPCPHMDLID